MTRSFFNVCHIRQTKTVLKAGQTPLRVVAPIEEEQEQEQEEQEQEEQEQEEQEQEEQEYFEIFHSDTLMSIENSSVSAWCLFKESRIFPPFWRTIQLYASFFLINLSLLGFVLYSSVQDYLGASVATHRL
jgi:hypothetical protein